MSHDPPLPEDPETAASPVEDDAPPAPEPEVAADVEAPEPAEAAEPEPAEAPPPVEAPDPEPVEALAPKEVEPQPREPVEVARVSGLTLGPLTGAELTLLSGEVTALLGPTGAGKSQLLRALIGLERPQAGTLQVAGHAVPQDARRARGLVGYVPPDPSFYPSQDAASLGRFLAGLHPRWVNPTYLLHLEALGIDRDRRLNELPLDQRLRVSLAAAFAMDPRVVLVDVPAALDDWGRELLLAGVAQLHRDQAVLLADGRVQGLEQLATRVAILARGRVRYTGPVDSLLGQLRAYRMADPAVAPALPDTLVVVHQRGATLYARGTPPDPLPAGLLTARELDLAEAYLAVVGETVPAPRSRAARVKYE